MLLIALVMVLAAIAPAEAVAGDTTRMPCYHCPRPTVICSARTGCVRVQELFYGAR